MNRSAGRQAARRAGGALCALLVALASCDDGEKADVVAMVGQRQLGAEELRQFALNLLPGLYSTKRGQAAREDYLQSLIDQELLLLEARNQKLERDEQLQKKLRAKQRAFIVSAYRQREIEPLAKVSEEEIRARFEEFGLARERWLTAIVVASEEEAHQLKARLDKGERWADLVQGHSLDEKSARRGGEMGFLNRSMAERMGMPTAVFDTLANKAVSPPLARGDSFQLVRFTGEREVELAPHHAAIKTQLMKIKVQEVEERKVEMLAYELGWSMSAEGRALLAAKARGLSGRGLELSAAERATALFVYEGGQVDVGEYLEELRLRRITSPKALADSAYIAEAGRRFALPTTMLAHAAARAGIPDEPAIVARSAEVERELLLTRLHQREVAAKVAVDDAEARGYIEENPEKFLLPERICYDELIAPDADTATRLAAELDGAADLLQISRQRGYKVRPRQPDSLVCMIAPRKIAYPQLWQALQEAPLGALRGPVETRDGAILFKVARREAPRPEPTDKALRRARASLRQRREQVRFDEFIGGLRAKYAGQVTVYADRLDAALPDALLAGLVRDPEKQIDNRPAND